MQTDSVETRVKIDVAFQEPSGSVWPYRVISTLGQLGVAVEGAAPAELPSEEAMAAALATDKADMTAGRYNPNNSAWTRLTANFGANAQHQARPVASRLREALVAFLQSGGIPNHPVNNEQYSFRDGPNALTVTRLTDDAAGTVTGTGGTEYYQVSGSAVWG